MSTTPNILNTILLPYISIVFIPKNNRIDTINVDNILAKDIAVALVLDSN